MASDGLTLPVDVCKDIVDMFVKDGAAMEVNISSKVREKILQDLSINNDRATQDGVALGGDVESVSADIFDEAQEQVFRLMETDSLPRFKQGKLFKE